MPTEWGKETAPSARRAKERWVYVCCAELTATFIVCQQQQHAPTVVGRPIRSKSPDVKCLCISADSLEHTSYLFHTLEHVDLGVSYVIIDDRLFSALLRST